MARRIGYATGVYGVFLCWMMVALYLLYFYTDVMGISPARAGLIFFIASMWDAVSDPLMGVLIEKTRTAWGKYRPYLLLAAVPFAASFAAIFYVPDLSGDGLFIWALVLHIVFRTCYTAIYIPYTGLIARLSSDADERASIAGIKGVFISLASLTVSFFALPTITYLGGEQEAVGFLRIAMLVAGVAVLALWACFLSTRESTADLASHRAEEAPVSAIKALTSNRAFVLIFIGVLLFTGCYSVLNKSIVYIFKYDIGDRDAARWALSAIAAAGILSPALWIPVTHWTSKKTVWIAGCVIAALSLSVIYFANIRDIAGLVIALFIAGCGIHAFLMTFYAMVADAIDYGEWQSGTRIEAPVFGIVSLANKTSLAIGTWLFTLLLEGIGFVPNVEQSAATIDGMRLIMVGVPIAGFLASAAVIAFFPFNTAEHRRIVQELAGRRNASQP
ncbi:MAG: glycoside-pentoside-hexuronide (GPH):cation symporter [Pseudomonadota bacterium]